MVSGNWTIVGEVRKCPKSLRSSTEVTAKRNMSFFGRVRARNATRFDFFTKMFVSNNLKISMFALFGRGHVGRSESIVGKRWGGFQIVEEHPEQLEQVWKSLDSESVWGV